MSDRDKMTEAQWEAVLNAECPPQNMGPPEIRIGQFVIRHTPNGIWIGRMNGEGGHFATEHVEHAIAQFYRANF